MLFTLNFVSFLKGLKNVKCLKLVIDRTKAPQKVSSLKDISLFGSFEFPDSGEYSGGLVCRSLAGLGKITCKTRAQIEKLSSSPFPIAGKTGAKTGDSELTAGLASGENVNVSAQSNSGPYSVKFIQHAENQTNPVQPNQVIPSDAALPQQPEAGFALKQTSGKRVLFSMEQKQIMIAFYDRQASTNVRAEPQDVIAEMQRRGVTPLKESQIKSWWSTYHQKKKRQMQNLVEEAQQLRQICYPSAQPPASLPNTSTVRSTVVTSVPTATTAAQVPLSVPVATPSVSPSVPTATTAAQVPLSVPVATPSVTPSVPTATTAAQVPLSVPVATPSVTPSVPTATTAAQVPLSVPVATPSVTPSVPTATTAAQVSLSVPVATPSVTPSVPTATTAAQVPFSFPVATPSVTPSVPIATTAAQVPLTATPNVPSSFPAATTTQTVPTLSILNGVHEWSFPPEFSQSTIGGRNGSNACTFIALCFGKLFVDQKLPLPVNLNLSSWIAALHYALVKGNEIHDDLFSSEAVNLSVQDAVEMAGDEFGVQALGQQHDFFGASLPEDLSEHLHRIASKNQRQCIGIVTPGRTMLFVIDDNQSVGLVDSHQHGAGTGAIVAHVGPGNEMHLITWFISIMRTFWNCELRRCSLTLIDY